VELPEDLLNSNM